VSRRPSARATSVRLSPISSFLSFLPFLRLFRRRLLISEVPSLTLLLVSLLHSWLRYPRIQRTFLLFTCSRRHPTFFPSLRPIHLIFLSQQTPSLICSPIKPLCLLLHSSPSRSPSLASKKSKTPPPLRRSRDSQCNTEVWTVVRALSIFVEHREVFQRREPRKRRQ
jgi:hypothetical protein